MKRNLIGALVLIFFALLGVFASFHQTINKLIWSAIAGPHLLGYTFMAMLLIIVVFVGLVLIKK